MSAPTDESADECLIHDARAGDDAAFAALVHRYKGRVFGIAARFVRNDHELDDVCQEIFIKVYHNLGKFRGEAPFEHWLSRIAVRACYDLLRRARRERANVTLDGIDVGIEDKLSASQARELVNWAMGKLNPEERLVITLLELEERSVREIAALTGWSESNVKVRAFRARQALKKILEKDYER